MAALLLASVARRAVQRTAPRGSEAPLRSLQAASRFVVPLALENHSHRFEIP